MGYVRGCLGLSVRSGLGGQELDRIRDHHRFHVLCAEIEQPHPHHDLSLECRRPLPLGVIVIFGLFIPSEDDITV